MTLLSSLSTGTTGLNSASTDLSVISDNLANANTVGFKQARADFEELLAQNVTAGNGQVGLGSNVADVQKLMAQGSLENTGNPTDLALQGNGFFEVAGTTTAGLSGNFLTRDGEFTINQNGLLVNEDGLTVQGYTANAQGTMGTALGNMQVGNVNSPPFATTAISLQGNLDASATTPAPFDPLNPSGTSNFATTATIYDSLGNADQATIYFSNDGAGNWEFHAMTDGANVQGGTPGTASEIGAGTLTFDTTGKLTDEAQTSDFNPARGTAPQALTFNFGDPTDAGGTGLAGLTQFSGASATTKVGQDGYAAGQLTSVQVEANGVVNGVFTNGQTRALGQVAVANVAAPDQLSRVGGNLYQATADSGPVAVGTAGQGGLGTISAGNLEQSNVDIATQFVDMITAQRNYEANSKTITTADTLLSELIQMKR
ncbi:MAG TPA: flagellar hook protein FlgE [Anaeromyxobacteraceae bacterium]|nr:flagellar hook protein FlgE [Anaeromyxobacteraceae bacterium]